MTQFIIFTVFALIVGVLLYFYPPSVPLKTKMILLVGAFILAVGGLLVLDALSYWTTILGLIGISFIASYFGEKKLSFIESSGERTEMILSFEEETATEMMEDVEGKLSEDSNEQKDTTSILDVVGIDLKELDDLEIENLVLLDEIEIVSELELEEEKNQTEPEYIESTSEEVLVTDGIQTLNDVIEEDDFAFLEKGRETLVEEVMEPQEPADKSEEEILMNREAWLDELEELEQAEDFIEIDILDSQEKPLVEQNALQETGILQTAEIIEIENNNLDELPENKADIMLEELTIVEEQLIEADEAATLPEVEESLQADYIPPVEKREEVIVQDEDLAIVQPDLDAAVQDMLLNTLDFYLQQGDYASYNDMLKSVIEQQLSEKDYYLFSKLLLKSYFLTNEKTELVLLRDEMQSRLSSYPVIIEEINQYQ